MGASPVTAILTLNVWATKFKLRVAVPDGTCFSVAWAVVLVWVLVVAVAVPAEVPAEAEVAVGVALAVGVPPEEHAARSSTTIRLSSVYIVPLCFIRFLFLFRIIVGMMLG